MEEKEEFGSLSREELVEFIAEHSEVIEPVAAYREPHLPKLLSIDVVLFDLYGTLFVTGQRGNDISLDPDSYFTASAGGRFKLRDLRLKLEREIKERSKSDKSSQIEVPETDILEVWKFVLSELDKPNELEIRIKNAIEYELVVNPSWSMPGAEAVVTRLKEFGKKVGLVTNSQFFTPLFFEAIFGKTMKDFGFDKELTTLSHQVGAAKPDPAVFKSILTQLKKMKIPPENVLYVGNDMLNDVYTAKQVGFKTAFFCGDKISSRFRSNDHRCKLLKPDVELSDLRQILEILPRNIEES
jgi:putative hydrolase of the HAD superfamily